MDGLSVRAVHLPRSILESTSTTILSSTLIPAWVPSGSLPDPRRGTRRRSSQGRRWRRSIEGVIAGRESCEQSEQVVRQPDRGRRKWTGKAAARDAVYANRRRIRGARGRALQRHRSERLERRNAHLYETGGMRRTAPPRTRERLETALHAHRWLQSRTLDADPRRRRHATLPEARLAALMALVIAPWADAVDRWRAPQVLSADPSPGFTPHHRFARLLVCVSEGAL